MYECFPNVEVSTFSSFLTAALEPKRDCWNLAEEYNALPRHWVCNRPNRCVLQLHVSVNKRGSALCTRAKAPCLSLSLTLQTQVDLPRSGERQHAGVRTLTNCFQSAECIWAETCPQMKKLNSARYREGVDGVGKDTSGVEEEFTSGNMKCSNCPHFLHWAAAKVQPLTYISPTQQV